ncbi:MAG TPA: DUF4870 domain-containing protein [Candidatus Eremiobacteraceae bacterium]|nr:DUF4870 domain-containing protein [Candidatus Eremiobacteraceae bacterium]
MSRTLDAIGGYIEIVDSGIASQDRTWAVVAHLAALTGHLIPFGSLVGPLVIWLVKRDESAFVNEHGKEAVNFQLSTFCYGVLYFAVGLGVVIEAGVHSANIAVLPVSLYWVIALGMLLWLSWTVCVIVGAVTAAGGKPFRYPLSIRFIS